MSFLRAMWGELCIVLLIVLGMALSAHAGIPTKRHENSLGVLQYFQNPNTYVMGALKDGQILHYGNRYATSIRIQPSYTFGLYTEQLLLCGNLSEQLDFEHPVIITYKTVAHETISGIGCHELEAVDPVGAKVIPGLTNDEPR